MPLWMSVTRALATVLGPSRAEISASARPPISAYGVRMPDHAPGGPPLFVVGPPRSGTTLTQSLLNAHPHQAVAPETHFLDKWLQEYGGHDLDDDDTFAEFWQAFAASIDFRKLGLDATAVQASLLAAQPRDLKAVWTTVLAAYADRTGKVRIGEKTPGHFRFLDTLFEWFPDARVVFMVRDPRAVVASTLALGERLEWAAEFGVQQIARRWVDAMAAASRWNGDPRVVFVQYESLVTQPEAELGRVLQFAELSDAREAILARVETETLPGGAFTPRSQVSSDHIDAWRTALTGRQIAIVDRVAGVVMTTIGYATEPVTLSSRIYLAASGDGTRSPRPAALAKRAVHKARSTLRSGPR